jgi:fumarate reductase flavoprotein subunit
MGTAMVQKLQEVCKDKGIEILLQTPATALLTDDNGAVCGVESQTKDKTVQFQAKAVILATGGVAGSVASLHEFFPHLFDLGDTNFTFGSALCVGDGIHMAEKLGADCRKAMGVLLKGPSHLGPGGTQALTYSADAIIVTQHGKRFIDEEKIWSYHAALNNIPGKTTYTIADAKLVNKLSEILPPQPKPGTSQDPVTLLEGLQQEAARGKDTCICQDLREAAEFFGIPADALLQTVADYNAMCAAGKDTALNKDPKHLQPIDTAPYYVLKGVRSTDSTYGGVRINDSFQALRPDGSPIGGLYAIGDVATGFVAEIYAPPGAGFTWSLNSGHMCGKIVADTIL